MKRIIDKFSRDELKNPITRKTVEERCENESHKATLNEIWRDYNEMIDPLNVLREMNEYQVRLARDPNYRRLEFYS